MEYEVVGSRPKRTWREVVEQDSQTRKLNKEDAVVHKMDEVDKGCPMIRMGVSG